MVSSVMGGCYESSCDTLSQPLILTACWRTVIVQCLLEVVQHHVGDVYNLSVAFVGLRELLCYESSHGIFCFLVSKETPASMALSYCFMVYWLLVALISP